MSQISLKSISGITSITTPAGVDNQLTVHTNDTTEKLKVTSDGVNITGVCTATSFSGDGSNLTGITQTTINSNTNNYVVTATGTANTLQGESTLTFDGDTLLLKSSTDGRRVSFAGDGTSHYMKYDNTLGGIILNGYGGIAFETNGTNERLRIASNGQVSISNDGTTDGLLTIKGNSDQVSTPSIRLLDGSDTREVSITNTSGDFVASVHGNDNAIHGHIKMFESGIFDINNGGASGSNTNRLRIDVSGHMGLGVLPNANWPTNNDFKALQIGTGACVFGRGSGDEDRGGIAVNWYSTGSANKYIGNGNAARIYLADGNIYFANAGANSSGANAAMTITDRMTINVNGDIGVNCTPLGSDPFKLDVTGTAFNVARFTRSSGVTGVRIEGNGAAEAVYFSLKTLNTTANSGCVIEGVDAQGNGTSWIKLYTEDSSTNAGAISLHTRPASGSTTERFRITSTGLIQAKSLSGSYYPIASVNDGSTSARAATSAWEIKKTLGPRAKTGYYYLKNPYDSSVNTWWCDMDTDGGGWILVAHTGEGQMSSMNTSDGNHWYNRSNKGGFDSVGSGYYKGGGYWRTSGGAWAENTCGQLMWDVRTHNVTYNNYAVSKVVFNWGTDQALPTGGSGYSNIPNANNRRFNEWCYEVVGAPGFNPANYHQNARSNVINGNNHFTEHMVMTWSFRGTGGGGDDSDSPYWMIGSHHDGLHQHYEESLSGSDGVYGDGGYQVASNEDTGWGGGGANDGYSRIARHTDSGTCNIWLR